MAEPVRCSWGNSHPLYIPYHDEEWGVPSHDDRHLFEMLCLEGAQAGLSWLTVLKKRENYRLLFDDFEVREISRYDERKIKSLFEDARIIRNRLKIDAAVTNAKAFLKVREEFGSFDAYIWRFTGGRPFMNRRRTLKDIPSSTKESDAMSADLKKRGFTFVGTTICYAFMQSVGMVNDHTTDCFRYKVILERYG
jgi:DNA-3-methyladenine glycosylase I